MILNRFTPFPILKDPEKALARSDAHKQKNYHPSVPAVE
jgi:hypothetical protein